MGSCLLFRSQLNHTAESLIGSEGVDTYFHQIVAGISFLVSAQIRLLILVFQAATQINEQTMTFVPKLLAIMVLLGFLGSSMLVMLQEFFQYIVELIAKG